MVSCRACLCRRPCVHPVSASHLKVVPVPELLSQNGRIPLSAAWMRCGGFGVYVGALPGHCAPDDTLWHSQLLVSPAPRYLRASFRWKMDGFSTAPLAMNCRASPFPELLQLKGNECRNVWHPLMLLKPVAVESVCPARGAWTDEQSKPMHCLMTPWQSYHGHPDRPRTCDFVLAGGVC